MPTATDYLVVGAGASGLAFTDTLVAETEADVIVIDRRDAVGGHWLDVYPFVRLHIPSAYYGVNSLPLGEDRIDDAGENAGFYERATGEEVREHFAEAAARLTRTGRVRILIDDLFQRLEASGRVSRIDPSRPARMYRGTMLSARELRAVRQVEDVVRLGRVRRIEADRIVLAQGQVETSPDALHVDCTALGLRDAPATPIFQPGQIVLQQVRQNSPCFNAALIGFVEAHWDDNVDKNRLCPPNPYAGSIEDWPRLMSLTWATEYQWLSEPDLSAWVAQSRLNLLRALPDHAAKPSVQNALQRYLTHVGPAIERLRQLDGDGPAHRPAATSR